MRRGDEIGARSVLGTLGPVPRTSLSCACCVWQAHGERAKAVARLCNRGAISNFSDSLSAAHSSLQYKGIALGEERRAGIYAVNNLITSSS